MFNLGLSKTGQVVSTWVADTQRKPKLGYMKPLTGPHAARRLDIAGLGFMFRVSKRLL